jgi:L-alanine-DL-glutamate epimerase-like enolase superfamily enzyme
VKITRISVSNHSIPLEPAFLPTWDSRPRPRYGAMIVRIDTDEGITGFGSGDTMSGFEGHEDLFIGQDPLNIEHLYQIISNLSFHYGKHWPLDLALWDIIGKAKGEPVWKLLGGTNPRIKAYASLGQRRNRAETVEAVRARMAEGFAAVKLRFWRQNWREEVETVEAVRKAVGGGVALMVDCNQAWRMQWDTTPSRSVDEALQLIRALEPLGITWIEEPIFRGDYEGLRRLRQESEIPIAGGELTREVHESRFLIDHGCYDILQSDVALAGGITGLAPIARHARDKEIVFTPHTWGNGIMMAAALHLTVGTGGAPYIELPCDPPFFTPKARDFVLKQLIKTDAQGEIMLDNAPGLGIELAPGILALT